MLEISSTVEKQKVEASWDWNMLSVWIHKQSAPPIGGVLLLDWHGHYFVIRLLEEIELRVFQIMVYTGHVKQGMVVFDPPVILPEGLQVRIEVPEIV